MSSGAGASRKQVFISYSHEPQGNIKFVRWLAGNLRNVGFSPWLDEEKIPGGEDYYDAITKAVEESDVGVFVLTSCWVEREWTQHEVALFGQHKQKRKVAVEREPTSLKGLGPHLGKLHKISWPPDDTSLGERFWQVYCGIQGIALGPHDEWEEKGLNLLGRTAPLGVPHEAKNEVPEQRQTASSPKACLHRKLTLPCKGKPLLSIYSEKWTFLATDRDEWLGISPAAELHSPISGLSRHATAAVSSCGALLVGLYSSQVARLEGDEWEYLPQEAPVLSLCACPGGDVAGTSAGSIVLMGTAGKATVLCRMRDPVSALAYFESGVAVIGSRGALGRISWPPERAGEDLSWVESGAVRRPVGFFSAGELDHIGIYSSTRIALVQPVTGRLTHCHHEFEAGIRDIVFFGPQRWPYGVLTDSGELILVDSALNQTMPVRLPGFAPVQGCASGGWSGVSTVWTADGMLYRLSPDGRVDRIADGDVILAFSPSSENRLVHIIRHTAEGSTLEIGSF